MNTVDDGPFPDTGRRGVSLCPGADRPSAHARSLAIRSLDHEAPA